MPGREGFLKSEDERMALQMSSYQGGRVLSLPTTEDKKGRCHQLRCSHQRLSFPEETQVVV